MRDEWGSLREFRGKARELGGLCLRAFGLENGRIGSGLHVKKTRLARKKKRDLRNDISGQTIGTVHVRKHEDQTRNSWGLRDEGVLWRKNDKTLLNNSEEDSNK